MQQSSLSIHKRSSRERLRDMLELKHLAKAGFWPFKTDETILGTYQRHSCCYFICCHVQSILYSCGRSMFHSLGEIYGSLEGYSVTLQTYGCQSSKPETPELSCWMHFVMCTCKKCIFSSLLHRELKFPLRAVMSWSSSEAATVNLETSNVHEELEWCLPLSLALHWSVMKLLKTSVSKLCHALAVMETLTRWGINLYYHQMGHTSLQLQSVNTNTPLT